MTFIINILVAVIPILVVGFVLLLFVRLVNAVERIADALDKR